MTFVETLIKMYSDNISNIFTVTGNISDIFLINNNDEIIEDKPKSILINRFGENNHIVLYSPSRGLRYINKKHKEEFLSYDSDLSNKHKKVFGLEYADSKYNIVSGLHHIKSLLGEYSLLKKKKGSVIKNLVVIIEDSDIIFPNKPINQMGSDEKMMISVAREIFANPDFITSNDIVIMLSKNFYALAEDIRDIPTLENIEIDLPDEKSRKEYIQYFSKLHKRRFKKEFINEISTLTAGITLTSLKSILKEKTTDIKENITQEVSKIISRAMNGKVSVMYPSHGYDQVIGYEKIKHELGKLKKRMFFSNTKLIWKGLMFVGPTGVGKDYILEAFIHDVKLPALKIGNLKSKWYGETLEIVENLKRIVKSFGKVILVKTEADTMFSNPESKDNHQTDTELMGVFLDWMGDNKDRGKIYWVFNTSRPQNLPTDFQRRIEIKIPILDLKEDEKWEFILKICDEFDIEIYSTHRGAIMKETMGLSNSNLRDIVAEIATEYILRKGESKIDIVEIITNINFLVAEEARKEQTSNAIKYSTYKHLTE